MAFPPDLLEGLKVSHWKKSDAWRVVVEVDSWDNIPSITRWLEHHGYSVSTNLATDTITFMKGVARYSAKIGVGSGIGMTASGSSATVFSYDELIYLVPKSWQRVQSPDQLSINEVVSEFYGIDTYTDSILNDLLDSLSEAGYNLDGPQV